MLHPRCAADPEPTKSVFRFIQDHRRTLARAAFAQATTVSTDLARKTSLRADRKARHLEIAGDEIERITGTHASAAGCCADGKGRGRWVEPIGLLCRIGLDARVAGRRVTAEVALEAGVDHVGLGSDFDGVSGATPQGIDSAADLPRITQALLDRGYSADDIRKILGGNTLRVFAEVERVSNEMKAH